jgi:NAD(P)-dependent dehydrogenase (short-subunit alcohol dehydrogenase family)
MYYPGVSEKRVLITGASSGLGLAMAKALLEHGARVLVTGRDQEKIDLAVSTLKELSGECAGSLIDVRSEHSIREGVNAMVHRWGGIDVLINNAGIGMRTVDPEFLVKPKSFWEISSSGFRDLIDTNLTGYFLAAKTVVPHFLDQGSGRIINIGINPETMKRKGFVPYGPSRAATQSLSHIMAQDLACHRVTVNILLPGGPTETGMLPDEFHGGILPDAFRGEMSPQMLSPDIMAEPIRFLCSDDAEDVHDQQIVAKDFPLWRANHHQISRA